MRRSVCLILTVIGLLLAAVRPSRAHNDEEFGLAEYYEMWDKMKETPVVYWSEYHQLPLPMPGLGIGQGLSHKERMEALTVPVVRQFLFQGRTDFITLEAIYMEEISRWESVAVYLMPNAEVQKEWIDFGHRMSSILRNHLHRDVSRARAIALRRVEQGYRERGERFDYSRFDYDPASWVWELPGLPMLGNENGM